MPRFEEFLPPGAILLTLRVALRVAVRLLDSNPDYVPQHLEVLARQCDTEEHASVLRVLARLCKDGHHSVVELALSAIIDRIPEDPADMDVAIMETLEDRKRRMEKDPHRN